MSNRRARHIRHPESDFERAREGDPSAWSRLVRAHTTLILGTAARVGLSREDAEDVTQTVWTTLATRGHAVRDARALPAWLITTTRRMALRARSRSRAAECDEISTDLPSDMPSVDDLLSRAEEIETVRRAMTELSDRCRSLLVALFEERKPNYKRITDALGLPRGSIGPTRARCLAELYRLVERAAEIERNEAP